MELRQFKQGSDFKELIKEMYMDNINSSALNAMGIEMRWLKASVCSERSESMCKCTGVCGSRTANNSGQLGLRFMHKTGLNSGAQSHTTALSYAVSASAPSTSGKQNSSQTPHWSFSGSNPISVSHYIQVNSTSFWCSQLPVFFFIFYFRFGCLTLDFMLKPHPVLHHQHGHGWHSSCWYYM